MGLELEALRQGTHSADLRAQRLAVAADSLQEIRAEMPTMDDGWDVKAEVQYRTHFRKEQYLIKWKGYGEDRGTWEPLEHRSDDVKEQAARVRDIALTAGARTSAGAALALPPNSTGPSTAASATACPDGRRSAAR
jgi:hypothetical protein